MGKNVHWTIVLLSFLVYMINYLDRVALPITVPMIEKDLAPNAEQFGMIFGSFFFGHAVFNFIGGLAADKSGVTLVIGLAVGLQSLSRGLTAVATGFYSILVLHVLFRTAEGPICASANKMINGWPPRKQVTTAVGFLSAGPPLGGVVTGPIVGYLVLTFGWRPVFMIILVIGIVRMVVWFFIAANSPDKHKHVNQEGLILISKMKQEEDALETAENQTAHSLGYYLEQPIILVTVFAFFCYNYILFFFLNRLPSYLVQQHHLDIKQMSLTTIIPWIVGFVGLVLEGYISDKIFNFAGRLSLLHKIVLAVCLLMTAPYVGLAGAVSSVVPAVLLMSISIFFLYVTGVIYRAIVQDAVRKSRVGGASGFIHLIGSVSGIVGPTITGYVVQSTGKFDSVFILIGTIAVLSTVLVLLVTKTPRTAMKASQA